MLKNIDPLLVPRLLHRLAAMGHGDEIAVVDRNYPAFSAGPEVIDLAGVDINATVRAILSVMPLDTFAGPPLLFMESVTGDKMLPIHHEIAAIARTAENRTIPVQGLTRDEFYERAGRAAAVVATTEARAYGCILLVKGVIA